MTEAAVTPIQFNPGKYELTDSQSAAVFTKVWGHQFVTCRRTPGGGRLDKHGIDYEVVLRYGADDTTRIFNVDVKRVMKATLADVMAGKWNIALEFKSEGDFNDDGWVGSEPPKRCDYIVLVYPDGVLPLDYRMLRRVWAQNKDLWLADGARTPNEMSRVSRLTNKNGRSTWVTSCCWVGYSELTDAMLALPLNLEEAA